MRSAANNSMKQQQFALESTGTLLFPYYYNALERNWYFSSYPGVFFFFFLDRWFSWKCLIFQSVTAFDTCFEGVEIVYHRSNSKISSLMKKSGVWPVFWTTHDPPGEQPALHLRPSSSRLRLSQVTSHPSTTVSAQSTPLISGYKSNLSYLKLMVACEAGAPGRTGAITIRTEIQ